MTDNDQMIGEAPTRLARKLPAGLLDTGFASLATFSIGIAAANLLDARDLGVYAVFFTAFMFGTILPRNLVFTPAEVTAVSRSLSVRLQLLGQSMRLGSPLAVVGASSVFIAAAITRPLTDSSVLVALVVTTGIATAISPIQDHIRKLFHIADHSWQAAIVSAVQLVVAAGAIITMAALNVPTAWIPFGALAIANAVSITVAVALALRVGARGGRPTLRFRQLLDTGKWLLLQSAVPSIAGFGTAAIIVSLAGPEALGHAEAARVVSQPVIVLASGLTAVLAPRVMEAAMVKDLASARRVRRIYLSLVVAGGAGFLVIAGHSWSLNPMEFLVPAAYVVPGLVAVTVVANMFGAAEYLQINEILGAKKEKTLSFIAIVTSPIVVLVSLTAATTEAFARAIGRLFEAWARLGLQGATLRRYYRE